MSAAAQQLGQADEDRPDIAPEVHHDGAQTADMDRDFDDEAVVGPAAGLL